MFPSRRLHPNCEEDLVSGDLKYLYSAYWLCFLISGVMVECDFGQEIEWRQEVELVSLSELHTPL